MRTMKLCHACKKALDLGRETGRRDACPSCNADLHCCLNCRFHDPSVAKQCRETQADLVRDKNKANFCDYFIFAEAAQGPAGVDRAGAARTALDDLFRK